LKYTKTNNPNAKGPVCAVSVFLQPDIYIKAPLAALLSETARIIYNVGSKVAVRAKTTVQGVIDFCESISQGCWQLFYLAVSDEYLNDIEHWEEILWRPLLVAERDDKPVWTLLTDLKHATLLQRFGFEIVKSGELVPGKVPAWGLKRMPSKSSVSFSERVGSMDGSGNSGNSGNEMSSNYNTPSPAVNNHNFTSQS